MLNCCPVSLVRCVNRAATSFLLKLEIKTESLFMLKGDKGLGGTPSLAAVI
jgi:hypothetical protein